MVESSAIVPKRKSGFLPVLVVLFLIAYSLMTMLIFEQGNTIESQRLLIRQLFSDSSELTAMKGREAQKRHAAQAHPGPQAKRQELPKARPHRLQPRVDEPQAPADLRRTTIKL